MQITPPPKPGGDLNHAVVPRAIGTAPTRPDLQQSSSAALGVVLHVCRQIRFGRIA